MFKVTEMILKETENLDLLYDIFQKSDVNHKDISKENFYLLCKRPNTKIYLINENQGYIYLHHTNEWGIYIDPKFKGHGLHNKAFLEMCKINPRKYYWGTVRNNNFPAMKALTKLGFLPKGLVFAIDKKDIKFID